MAIGMNNADDKLEAILEMRRLVGVLARNQAYLNAMLAIQVRAGAVDEKQWAKAVSEETAKLVGLSFTEILALITDSKGRL